MKKYKQIFQDKATLLPVIHCKNIMQTFPNVDMCVQHNTKGVFLINHGISSKSMGEIYKEIRLIFPELWIGINFLGLETKDMFFYAKDLGDINGIWADCSEIDDTKEIQIDADKINKERSDWNGLYFGGVDFKYQLPVNDITKTTKIAKDFMDVITTSGVGTGYAPEVDKIKTMKKVAGDIPLAIASGINADNIHLFWDYADCFLVSTGISKDFHNLDETLLQDLLNKVKLYNEI